MHEKWYRNTRKNQRKRYKKEKRITTVEKVKFRLAVEYEIHSSELPNVLGLGSRRVTRKKFRNERDTKRLYAKPIRNNREEIVQ